MCVDLGHGMHHDMGSGTMVEAMANVMAWAVAHVTCLGMSHGMDNGMHHESWHEPWYHARDRGRCYGMNDDTRQVS